MHTWEDPEIYQIQTLPGKSKWLVKGNLEVMPHSWFKLPQEYVSGILPLVSILCLLLHLSTCTVLSPPNTYFTCSITFCVCGGSSSAKLKGQGLVTGHWSPRPNLNLWPGTETLLQAITWSRPPKFTRTLLASVCSCIIMYAKYHFPGDIDSKEYACNAGDLGSILGSGRSPGEGNGKLHYSCLENPMDRGAWCATVHGVVKIQTRLSNKHYTFIISMITISSLKGLSDTKRNNTPSCLLPEDAKNHQNWWWCHRVFHNFFQ